MKDFSRTQNTEIVEAYLKRCRNKPGSHDAHLKYLARKLTEVQGSREQRGEEHYVYVYLNPLKPGKFEYTLPSGKTIKFKHEPFYVGKGKGNRAEGHLRRTESRSLKNHTLNKIAREGLEPIIKVSASRAGDCMAQAAEINLILGIGRRNLKTGPLANLTNGGDGMGGYKATKETRAKLSAAHKGKPKSAEHNAKVSAAMKGRRPSEKTLAAAVAVNTGRKHTAEHKARISAASKGHVVTMATRKRIGASKIGIPRDAETKAKLSKALKGKPWSAARRAAHNANK